MEGQENILEAILEDVCLDDCQDVEMLDSEFLEEGELREEGACLELTESGGGVETKANPQSQSKNRKRKTKKRKNKNKKSGSVSNVTNVGDINRFVIDTCKRLKERKPYLIWNAVGCLGISALSDLVKEVDAIQACGGQMTSDGKRSRFGGGILWNILKTRDPKAYKEIMTKGKEFEKQFRPQNIKQTQDKHKEVVPTQNTAQQASSDPMIEQVSAGSELITPPLNNDQLESSTAHGHAERVSALSRIRVPVSYADLVEDDVKEE